MYHKKLGHIYVGVDCHKFTHTASIINAFNDHLDTITFNNNKEGFNSLISLVSKYLENEITPVYGLEDCKHLGHLLSSYLLQRGFIVKVVNSTYTYSERKNNPIISKTDEIDSLCIAKVTLDRLDNLPNAANDDLYWTIKQLSKMRESLVDSSVVYKNKLHAQLLHHYPDYQKFFSAFDNTTALAFWETYPNPSILKRIPITEVVDLICKSSNNLYKPSRAKYILDLVNNYDYALIDYQEERDSLIKVMVKQLRYTKEELKIIDKEIDLVVQKTGYKLDTFIGIDKVLAAKIISEIGNIDRFTSSDKLARYAGIAPVSFSSGNSTKWIDNKYGNRTLNSYIFIVACVVINEGCTNATKICNPIFLDYYLKKIAEGKTKHQAILQVMRRIINIIYGLMKNRTEYVHPKELSDKLQKLHRERITKERQEKEKVKN
jgi:transposase